MKFFEIFFSNVQLCHFYYQEYYQVCISHPENIKLSIIYNILTFLARLAAWFVQIHQPAIEPGPATLSRHRSMRQEPNDAHYFNAVCLS
jgi:hypothetical protein